MNRRNLFGPVLGAIFVLATASAASGQDGSVTYGLVPSDGEESTPSFSEMTADPPRWTAEADFITLDRLGGGNQALVSKVPFLKNPNTDPGVEVLNSGDFQQGFSGGPRLSLIRHDDSGYDLEVSYFQITGWNSERSIGPDHPVDWLVMKCPGDFVQTNQLLDTQAMVWYYASQLYNAEINVRWNPLPRVTMLTGFRWVNLHENLTGELEPPTVGIEPPFWITGTTNNLWGLQIGADGKLLDLGRFSINGLVKAGLYDNDAEQTTAVSVIHKQVRTASASTNHAAFVGETGLRCTYQVTKRLSLTAGYEAIWIEGVALAPGQIPETYVLTSPKTVDALGVNCNSGVFYHGAVVGLQYAF